MAIPAFLAPILAQGLGLIGNAVLAKGKDWVEQKTGIKLDQPLSAEDTLKLRQYEMDHEEELLKLKLEENKLDVEIFKIGTNLIVEENKGVTGRWQADMSSDSWLSKNIRPMTLIYILVVYTAMTFTSGFGLSIPATYVELLGQWGMLIMSAYFGGRTIEKIMDMRSKK